MTPEQYAYVQELFLQVRELEPADRTQYLASLDAQVRAEVESLLKSDSACPEFLEPRAFADSDTTTAVVENRNELRTVGPYQLLQQIGEGGQGSVYMAEQREPIERKVAVKLIKPGMDSSRFWPGSMPNNKRWP